MTNIFNNSSRLKQIVELSNWQLYEVTAPEGAIKSVSWQEIQQKGPASYYELNHHYIFAPKPRYDQSLRDAYAELGFGTSLRLKSLEDHVNMVGNGAIEVGGYLTYCFTRLIFSPTVLIATSPQSALIPKPPAVMIPYSYVIDKFEKYFKIVLPEDFGLSAPIPMPTVPKPQ